MTVDQINGIFESVGACFNAWSCWILLRDKKVRGTSVAAHGFYTGWGLWNLIYYPALSQWFSFFGGAALTTFSLTWLILAIFYLHREGKLQWPPKLRSRMRSSASFLTKTFLPAKESNWF